MVTDYNSVFDDQFPLSGRRSLQAVLAGEQGVRQVTPSHSTDHNHPLI